MLAARMWYRILRLVTADNGCPPQPLPTVKRLSSLVMLLLYLAVECKRLEQVRLLTSMSRCRAAPCRAILRNYYMEKYSIQNQITNYIGSLRRQVQDSYHDALLIFYTVRNYLTFAHIRTSCRLSLYLVGGASISLILNST